MLILLPPSESKSPPAEGSRLDLAAMSSPVLNPTRERLVEALVRVCGRDPEAAASALKLGPTQGDLVARNAALREEPTGRADSVYTGVLYDRIDVGSLDAAARRRLTGRVAIASALFGVVRPGDLIPAYRLSGTTTLPGLGALAGIWRAVLGPVLEDLAGDLLLDLRSGPYLNLHRPHGALARRTVTLRVLNETGSGARTVVSHANKATKGEVVRALVSHDVQARDAAGLAAALRDLGWTVELDDARADRVVLDVIV